MTGATKAYRATLPLVTLIIASAACELVAGIKNRPLAVGGAGGAGLTATGGQAGTASGLAGAGGSVGGAGGIAGAVIGAAGGMAGGPTRAGTSCSTKGTYDCDGQRSRQPLFCVDNLWWQALGLCKSDELCDTGPGTTHGFCLPIQPECADHAPGDSVCIGGELRACGPDLVTSTLVNPCADSAGPCARCRPVTLVSGQPMNTIRSIGIDEANVYWASIALGTPILAVPLDGSGGVTTAGGLGGRSGAGPIIAVRNGSAYGLQRIGTGNVPIKIPLGGGDTVLLDGNERRVGVTTAIAVDDTNVYWPTGSSPVVVRKAPLDGSAGTDLGSSSDLVYAMISDGTKVYWTTPSTVEAASVESGDVVTLAFNQTPRGIAVRNGTVYWNNGGGGVMTVSVEGGPPHPLASGPGLGAASSDLIPGIVADGATVYWADAVRGAIMRVPAEGGSASVIAQAATPNGLVADQTNLYWANSALGSIMKIAK